MSSYDEGLSDSDLLDEDFELSSSDEYDSDEELNNDFILQHNDLRRHTDLTARINKRKRNERTDQVDTCKKICTVEIIDDDEETLIHAQQQYQQPLIATMPMDCFQIVLNYINYRCICRLKMTGCRILYKRMKILVKHLQMNPCHACTGQNGPQTLATYCYCIRPKHGTFDNITSIKITPAFVKKGLAQIQVGIVWIRKDYVEAFQNLTSLQLTSPQFTSRTKCMIDPRILKYLPSTLHTLAISTGNAKLFVKESFGHIKNLQRLALSSKLTAKDVSLLPSTLTQLSIFSVDMSIVTDDTMPFTPNLLHLRIFSFSKGHFKFLPRSLKSLYVYHRHYMAVDAFNDPPPHLEYLAFEFPHSVHWSQSNTIPSTVTHLENVSTELVKIVNFALPPMLRILKCRISIPTLCIIQEQFGIPSSIRFLQIEGDKTLLSKLADWYLPNLQNLMIHDEFDAPWEAIPPTVTRLLVQSTSRKIMPITKLPTSLKILHICISDFYAAKDIKTDGNQLLDYLEVRSLKSPDNPEFSESELIALSKICKDGSYPSVPNILNRFAKYSLCYGDFEPGSMKKFCESFSSQCYPTPPYLQNWN